MYNITSTQLYICNPFDWALGRIYMYTQKLNKIKYSICDILHTHISLENVTIVEHVMFLSLRLIIDHFAII